MTNRAVQIDTWFPTSILIDKLDSNKHNLKALVARAYKIREDNQNAKPDWLCDTYSSINNYDLTKDDLFVPMIKDLCLLVNEFAKYFGARPTHIKCKDAWVNIAPPGDYQEYHIHTESHFSAVVYLKTSPNCGDIVFRSPAANTDMFSLPIKENLPSNYATCYYEPEDLKVIVVRSNLLHMVKKNKSNQDRISAAFNFVV
jgi:uncharacterized protein (TIGR02466 family)